MKRKIILFGFLAERFGKEHYYDVRNPAEAVRALCANYKEFKLLCFEFSEPGFNVITDYGDIEEKQLYDPCSGDIKIIPVIHGSGSFFRIILGVALIGLSFGGFLPATPIIAGLTTSFSSLAFGFGISLVLGGIAQLLTPTPKAPNVDSSNKQFRSFSFDGPINLVAQGSPIPIGYGRMIIGSVVISTSILTDNVSVADGNVGGGKTPNPADDAEGDQPTKDNNNPNIFQTL